MTQWKILERVDQFGEVVERHVVPTDSSHLLDRQCWCEPKPEPNPTPLFVHRATN